MKKFLTACLFSSIFLSSALPTLAASGVTNKNLFAGRLVKLGTDSAVYYIGPDQKRHAFPNAKIYFSWYSDFQQVQVIDSFEMSLYALGSNVTYRPGSRLVKISDVPEVYAVEPGGVLRNIPTEAAAKSLYGDDWAKQVDDLDISFFFDYQIGGTIDIIDDKPVYPRGTPVYLDGEHYVVDKSSEDVFWLRPLTEEARTENGFDRAEEHTINPSWRELYNIGLPVLVPEAGYACPACSMSWSLRAADPFVERASSNARYTISLPSTWGVSFFPSAEQASGDLMVSTDASMIADGAKVTLTRRAMIDGDTLESEGSRIAATVDASLGSLYRQGASMDQIGTYDVVRSRFIDESETDLVWTRVYLSGSSFYELTYTAPLLSFMKGRDIAQKAFASFKVNESIPE